MLLDELFDDDDLSVADPDSGVVSIRDAAFYLGIPPSLITREIQTGRRSFVERAVPPPAETVVKRPRISFRFARTTP
jgi:hypothetical protein